MKNMWNDWKLTYYGLPTPGHLSTQVEGDLEKAEEAIVSAMQKLQKNVNVRIEDTRDYFRYYTVLFNNVPVGNVWENSKTDSLGISISSHGFTKDELEEISR